MKKRSIYSIFFLLFISMLALRAGNFVYSKEDAQDDVVFVDRTNGEIEVLSDEIQGKKNKVNKIKEKQKKYTEAIRAKQKEKSTLDNQLAILDNRLAKIKLDVEAVEINIDKMGLEIQRVKLAIKDRNIEIEDEKNSIANVLKVLHQEDQGDALEILLLNTSLSDFLTQVQYLEDLNKGVRESLSKLKHLRDDLLKEEKKLNDKNTKLALLKKELTEKQDQFKSEVENKEYLVRQVSSSETQYQTLLAQAKKEQNDAASEIASLEKIVRAKLASLEGDQLSFNDNGLTWPVPKNTITALFHDPDYPYRHIFEHPAVDIRAGQGTPLKAAASGYVARAKDAGMGYSYIMIIHGDGLSTVYGHVSKIYVKEDEYVLQGQTIGLSGGMPGTPGAGRLTTGPHLHFEVRKEGFPVDPLQYLP